MDIERFLNSLFRMADEISHSDIVYTFFHPLLRDQQEANINATKVKGNRVCVPRFVIPVVCRKTNGEVNISHENITVVVWIYDGV